MCTTLNIKADIKFSQGHLKESLEIHLNVYGKKIVSVCVYVCVIWFADLFYNLDIQKKFHNTDEHLGIANSLTKMANIYSELGEKDKALDLHTQVYSK